MAIAPSHVIGAVPPQGKNHKPATWVITVPRGIRYTPNEQDGTVLAVGLSLALPVREIADRMGVPERTLRRHHAGAFRNAELKVGRPTYQPTPEEREFVRSIEGNTAHRHRAVDRVQQGNAEEVLCQGTAIGKGAGEPAGRSKNLRNGDG
jgi:hypothetical protein